MQENLPTANTSTPEPVISVATPTPVYEKPKQNSFLVILLSVLLLLSVSIAGFFAFQTQKLVNELKVKNEELIVNETTEPIATTDPTEDWETYTNKALGFELKYPSSFTIDKELNDQYNRATIFKNGSSTFEVMLRTAGGGLDKYSYMDNPDFSKSVLGGKNANIYVYDSSKNSCVSDGTGPECPISYVVYVAQNGSDLYHLGFFGDNNLSDLEKQILSTFKFTDSVTSKYTMSQISDACIKFQGSTKYWNSQYNECNAAGTSQNQLEVFCNNYGGKFVSNGSTCRHAQQEGIPCGPEATYYCSFE